MTYCSLRTAEIGLVASAFRFASQFDFLISRTYNFSRLKFGTYIGKLRGTFAPSTESSVIPLISKSQRANLGRVQLWASWRLRATSTLNRYAATGKGSTFG